MDPSSEDAAPVDMLRQYPCLLQNTPRNNARKVSDLKYHNNRDAPKARRRTIGKSQDNRTYDFNAQQNC
jgi:hypothetical protein